MLQDKIHEQAKYQVAQIMKEILHTVLMEVCKIKGYSLYGDSNKSRCFKLAIEILKLENDYDFKENPQHRPLLCKLLTDTESELESDLIKKIN